MIFNYIFFKEKRGYFNFKGRGFDFFCLPMKKTLNYFFIMTVEGERVRIEEWENALFLNKLPTLY